MVAPLSDYDISEDVFPLRDAMDTLLENVVSMYQSYNIPLPSRRYWTIGDPVIDCEQLVISFMQMYLGAPGDEATTPRPCNGPRSMVVTVNVSRKQKINAKTGNAPSAADIQADSAWATVDTYAIMDSLGHLNAWGSGGQTNLIATATVPEPAGGYQTALVQITMLVP